MLLSFRRNLQKVGGECGGCSILSVPYEKQLEIKERQVMDLFLQQELFGFKFLGIQGSPQNKLYRNKMEYTFGDEMKDGPLTLGLHKKGRHIDIMTVDGCFLVDQDFIKVLTSTVEFFNEKTRKTITFIGFEYRSYTYRWNFFM